MLGGWYITVNRKTHLVGVVIGPVADRSVLPAINDGELRRQLAAANFTVENDDSFGIHFLVGPHRAVGVLNAVYWLPYTDQPWNMG